MTDASNPWSVHFSRTSFLLSVLGSHENVEDLHRERDILFSFRRKKQGDYMKLLGGDEYAFSLALVRRAIEDFGSLKYICVGGVWNGYSKQAKEFCEQNHIGLYNTAELSGGIWKDEYWSYAKKDEDGNNFYYFRSAN